MLGAERAAPGRLRMWAEALDKHLQGPERVSGDSYNWLAYRIGRAQPMLLRDAAKIYVAGMCMQPRPFSSRAETQAAVAAGEYVHSAYDWQMAFSEQLPAVIAFHYGYGVEGRFQGTYDRAFLPVMVPLEYVSGLAEELATVVVERDERGRRQRIGERIEKFLKEKIGGVGAAPTWNFSAGYAVEHIALSVLFRDYWRGQFGEPTATLYTAVNEAGYAIGRELHRMLHDPGPRAFDRGLERLRNEVEEARRAREEPSV